MCLVETIFLRPEPHSRWRKELHHKQNANKSCITNGTCIAEKSFPPSALHSGRRQELATNSRSALHSGRRQQLCDQQRAPPKHRSRNRHCTQVGHGNSVTYSTCITEISFSPSALHCTQVGDKCCATNCTCAIENTFSPSALHSSWRHKLYILVLSTGTAPKSATRAAPPTETSFPPPEPHLDWRQVLFYKQPLNHRSQLLQDRDPRAGKVCTTSRHSEAPRLRCTPDGAGTVQHTRRRREDLGGEVLHCGACTLRTLALLR